MAINNNGIINVTPDKIKSKINDDGAIVIKNRGKLLRCLQSNVDICFVTT